MSTTNVGNKFIKSIKGYHMVHSFHGFPNTDECQILSILLDDNGYVRSLTLDEAVYDDGQYEWSDDGKLKKTLFVSDTENLKTYTISPEINYKDVDELIKYIESNITLSNGYVHLEDLLTIGNDYITNKHAHYLIGEYLDSIKKMTNGSVVVCSSILGFNNALNITEPGEGALLVSNIRFTFESTTDDDDYNTTGILMRVTLYNAAMIEGVVVPLDDNPKHAVFETEDVKTFFSNADYSCQKTLYQQFIDYGV